MPQKPQPSPFWPTSERIPDIFPNAQQTPTVLNLPAKVTQQSAPGVLGFYRPKDDIIMLRPDAPPTGIASMHETGHAIWYRDLTPEQQQSWSKLHWAEMKRPNVPLSAVSTYPSDPSHSFAHAYGLYASDPLRLQKESPEAYNLIRSLSQFEYRRPGPM